MDDVGGKRLDLVTIAAFGKHDLEFVAAQPEHPLLVADDPDQPLRDLPEQCVARGVAERVVDLLEPIEIDQQHRARPAMMLGTGEEAVERFLHLAAVRQLGQRIVVGQASGLGRGTPLVGGVDRAPAKAEELARTAELWPSGGQPEMFGLAGNRGQRHFVERRFAGQQEGQVAPSATVVLGGEDIGEALSGKFGGRRAERPGDAFADINDAALAIDRPKPAPGRFLERADKRDGFVPVDALRWCFSGQTSKQRAIPISSGLRQTPARKLAPLMPLISFRPR